MGNSHHNIKITPLPKQSIFKVILFSERLLKSSVVCQLVKLVKREDVSSQSDQYQVTTFKHLVIASRLTLCYLFSPVFRCHSDNQPFNSQTHVGDLITGLAVIQIPIVVEFNWSMFRYGHKKPLNLLLLCLPKFTVVYVTVIQPLTFLKNVYFKKCSLTYRPWISFFKEIIISSRTS